ncbi:hypothetical protein [Limimaricola soesokkakensis]
MIAGLLAATASVAGEEETVCQTADLIVEGGMSMSRGRICRIAAREIPKLAACNVAVPEGVTLRSVDPPPKPCLGIFHCGEALIRLLSPGLMAKRRDPDRAFASVPDEPCFDSVVVHELTHAAYDSAECPFVDCPATAEYAAYATQVRSLPAEAREAFEATSAFDHCVSRDYGCQLIGRIMGGAAFIDRECF